MDDGIVTNVTYTTNLNYSEDNAYIIDEAESAAVSDGEIITDIYEIT